MSGDSSRNWSTTAIVVGVCVVIGFGAVYAMLGGDDNRAERQAAPEAAVAKSTAPSTSPITAPSTAPSTVQATIPNASSSPASATASVATAGQETPSAAPAAVLRGADGKPLNRGAMTTFVFKKQAMAIAEPPKFNGPDGKEMTLDDLKGKVVLLNLWATWCAPCRKEMPHLDQLQRDMGSDQFEVVAVSVDRGSAEKSKQFLAEVGATALRFYHDPTAKAGFSFMAIGMPTTLLFDRAGREIGRLVGPAEWHSDDAKNLIRAAIAAG